MDLSKILFITGKSGLFKLITQTKTGAIVEEMASKKRFPVFNNSKISVLENISIYRQNSDISLPDLLKAIYRKENAGNCVDYTADETTIKEYMKEILHDYDETQVHLSDMRKIFHWYSILNEAELIDLTKETDKTEEQ